MKIQSLDLLKEVPRSPRNTDIAGHVIAARCLDKCRADLGGTIGEYHSGCPLDDFWLDFIEIPYDEFRSFVETGPSDEEVSSWVLDHGTKRSRSDIIQWNNDMRYKRINEMPMELQEFLEGYIPEFIPANRIVNYWFDVYDIEEKRI